MKIDKKTTTTNIQFPRSSYLAVCCRNAFRNVSGWKSSLRSRVSSRRRPPSDLSTHVWMAMVLVTRPRRNNIGSSGPSHIWSQQIGVCGRGKVKVKGMFLYSVVSSPLDRSKRFTLFALPGRPVHSNTNSTSLGSILATHQLRTNKAGKTGASRSERKFPNFEKVAKGI